MKDRYVSFYRGPIKSVKGNYPTETWTMEQIYRYITTDKALESLTYDLRELRARDKLAYKVMKSKKCPFATFAGIFNYRDVYGLKCSTGAFGVDIDDLPTRERARELRDTLFMDKTLQTELAFVSPSDFGVKLVLPFEHRAMMKLNDCYVEAVHSAWDYLAIKYGIEEFIDKKNVDIARACFLCHDADAKLRDDYIINPLISNSK